MSSITPYGGIHPGNSPQSLKVILVYGSPPPNPSETIGRSCENGPIEHEAHSRTCSDSPRGQVTGTHRIPRSNEEDSSDEGVGASQSSDEKEDYEDSRSPDSSTTQAEQRTLFIRGLPDRVTLRDIIDAVRGGALLHVYLRARDHTANVSFVDPAAAQEFLQYTRSFGLYLAGKRVEVLWNDRQFYLPHYVESKINNGASRNMVIYNVNKSITEPLIRRDLDHIHNLIVVDIKFKQGNAYISTNSVHNALFARSCMMSRATYKGMRIGFFSDECAAPRAKVQNGPRKEARAPMKKPIPASNRFQLLSLEGARDDNSEEYGSLHSTFDSHYSDEGIAWVENRVPA
ncbi:RNA-binding protein [Aspergillus clavatus NRRL 1]|uniref:RRM domain-containing protein n=1 Tax=Aspergillus clavatus (strain ATCC 1007 / CBS 513.65 / DSM 816 / NCTC 3887 / NRRL 1 / QM 1276 / 107) TaxID=344612 RepID=A1C699_ASPCL|nr:uncharacterized protein ACLA_069500 [Aspergillus clavatus NRRL 1]EAW13920.1 conserved hypothetical protein [Aspergillus clavatus NRRL 1]